MVKKSLGYNNPFKENDKDLFDSQIYLNSMDDYYINNKDKERKDREIFYKYVEDVKKVYNSLSDDQKENILKNTYKTYFAIDSTINVYPSSFRSNKPDPNLYRTTKLIKSDGISYTPLYISDIPEFKSTHKKYINKTYSHSDINYILNKMDFGRVVNTLNKSFEDVIPDESALFAENGAILYKGPYKNLNKSK